MIPPLYSHRPLAALVRDAEYAEKIIFLFAAERPRQGVMTDRIF
jgi:hypothetical protein